MYPNDMLAPLPAGGELFHHLDLEGAFSETTAQFYAACVVAALAGLHARGIVYRDLKPGAVQPWQ